MTESESIQELLQIQAQQRAAHLGADAGLLVEIHADDFLSVANGQVTRPTREESRQRFQRYFDLVTFLAWEDTAPPLIWVAADASLATVIVQKRVHLRYADQAGAERTEETRFAWHETYRREGGRWRLAAMVSTNGQAVSS
ncbi:MAG TPA: DUF4440 domain-containing protein [Herpetosiphonaceae bacterium]|nr:DUF4440 domain-containing protein [Herpetosiphonaceae bacterium]